MSFQQLILYFWLIYIVACQFLIRHIRNHGIRACCTLLPCIMFTYLSCRDLARLDMSSVMTVSIYWMMSIRIIQMILFCPKEARTLYSFIFKLFWTLFPWIPNHESSKQWPILLDFVSGFIKLILNHWIVRWLSHCEASENYARSIMVSFLVLTSSHVSDLMIGLVRLVTRDQYTLLSISNYPLFSKSLREFWGRRYNRLASTAFNECIFKPIKFYLSSSMIASLVTFIISGLLHAHIALVVFDDKRAILPTFGFFVLHGILCCSESALPFRLPAALGWILTHLILFLTLPLCTNPSSRHGPLFFRNNPPPLFDVPWLPQLPIPTTCLE